MWAGVRLHIPGGCCCAISLAGNSGRSFGQNKRAANVAALCCDRTCLEGGFVEPDASLVESHASLVESYTGLFQTDASLVESHAGLVQANPGFVESHAGLVQANASFVEPDTGF